jgi:hypothetical protein
VPLWVGVRLSVAVWLALCDWLGVPVWLRLWVWEAVRDTDGDVVPDLDWVCVGETVPEGVPVALGVSV